jgi:hypothetical protein
MNTLSWPSDGLLIVMVAGEYWFSGLCASRLAHTLGGCLCAEKHSLASLHNIRVGDSVEKI